MTKEELALEVIDRLKKNIRMRVVRWTTIRRGSCWSVSVWRRSVPMRVSMW